MNQKLTKGNKTKKLLYDSAMILFKEKGYSNVSVDEIVKKAGTAKGTFYIYYDTKAKIIMELIKEYDDYYDEILKNLDNSLTADEKLDIIIKESLRFTSEEIGLELIKVLYQSQISLNEDINGIIDFNRSLYKIIGNIVREGQKKGEYFTELDAIYITNMIVRCIRGTFYEWCLHDGKFDIIKDGCEFLNMFKNGMKIRKDVYK